MRDLKGVEALRGLAAMGIAAYSWLWAIGMAGSPPAANFYLLYDLFFVISGFVIAQVYRARLTTGREAARFALLRFARVYPLHVAVLLTMLVVLSLSSHRAVFAPGGDQRSFLANLAMLQGFGVIDPDAWNAPAWFISVEFAISILFALLCLADALRSRSGLAALTVCVCLALWMQTGRADPLRSAGEGMMLSGFAGFMLGVLAQAVRRSRWWSGKLVEQGAAGATARESIAVAAAAALLIVAPAPVHAVAPVIFAALVLVISGARGGVTALLRAAPLQALARISFGVFMCHWPLVAPMTDLVLRSEIEALAIGAATPQEALAMATPLYLLAVIALAIVAGRWVERPTRDAMRTWIDRRGRGRVAAPARRSDVV